MKTNLWRDKTSRFAMLNELIKPCDWVALIEPKIGEVRIPTESKRVNCDHCGSASIIKFVQIPTVDLDTIYTGAILPDWACVIECRICGIRQQTVPAKPAIDNRN